MYFLLVLLAKIQPYPKDFKINPKKDKEVPLEAKKNVSDTSKNEQIAEYKNKMNTNQENLDLKHPSYMRRR